DLGPLLFNDDEAFVNINEKIELDCGIRRDYLYCRWEKDTNIMKVDDVYKGMFIGISPPEKTVNNQCGIVVDKATIEDQGIWTCKIYTLATILERKKLLPLKV
ncbi:unnamed protein product, partial [Meganyctiphanes norvegica]